MINFLRTVFNACRYLVPVIIFLYTAPGIKAQDCFDTIDLNETEIIGNKIRYKELYAGKKQLDLSQTGMSGKNIGELLSLNSNLSVRVTSPGNLSTIAYRGNNSSQTSLFWNGLNLNSVTTGQADLSQIPSFLSDIIDFSGKSNHHLPSTAGNILLSSQKDDHIGLKSNIMQEAGSGGYLSTAGSISYSNESLYSRMKMITTSSENNYPFKNRSKSFVNPPTETRQNASYTRHGIMAETGLTLNHSNNLEARFLYTSGQNEIPQPVHIAVLPNNENQEEQHLKSHINWLFASQSLHTGLSMGYSYDFLSYTNKALNIHSEILSTSLTNRLSAEMRFLKNLNYSGFVETCYASVATNNYNGTKSRIILEFGNHLNYETENLSIQGTFKVSKTDQESLQGLPGIAVTWKPIKMTHVEILADFHQTYRLPSMNDLYWNPGGNPELMAEKGQSSELGMGYIPFKNDYFDLKIHVTRYHLTADRQIVWQPDTIGSLWKPVNLDNFRSDGWELFLEANWKNQKNHFWSFKSSLTTVDAVVSRALNGFSTVHVAPAYVPVMEYFQIIKYRFKGITGTFSSRFTGKRYTDLSNTQQLDSFWKHDLGVNYKFLTRHLDIIINFSIENITDSGYEYYTWYPMPGIQFRTGVILEISKNKSK